MKYVVIEIQDTNDTISTLVTTHDTREEADSKYYQILSYAAVSNLPKHAASLLTDTGKCLKNDYYEREVAE